MLLALLLSACTTGQQPIAPTAAPAAPTAAPAAQATEIPGMGELAEQTDPQIKTTVGRIANNLDRFRGRTVTVSGEVDNIVSPHAFTIGGEDFGAEALIVSKQPLGELVEGQQETNAWVNGIVQVIGQVRPFNLSLYEQELGVDLRDELLQPCRQACDRARRACADAAPETGRRRRR
jgi:hypothetical protein